MEAEELFDSFQYSVITANAYSGTEIFLFCAGFLQTISFIQKYSTKPKFIDPFKFVLIRIIKIVPFYYFMILYVTYGIRFMGSGPTWNLFDYVLAPCEDHWWSNVMFINNFYPNFGAEESMCLPWTWFMAIYMQLSVVLPFVLYLVLHVPILFTSIHAFLCFSCIIIQGILIAVYNTGINPIEDSEYFTYIYIKPWS